MRKPPSQDKLDHFKKSLEKRIDWQTFFHLDTDQRASANQLLLEQNIISENPEGNYEVKPRIRGIVPASRAPTYFVHRKTAESLQEFYKSKGLQVSITKL